MKLNAILILFLFCAAACISEVKPILKPVESGIPTRIANQQKWLDQDTASKSITYENARTIKEDLDRIREKYNRLLGQGTLSAKDTASINRMLDENSEKMFKAQRSRKLQSNPDQR